VIAATETLETRRTTASGGGRAVWDVARWELGRLLASRSTWALAAGAELFFVALLLVKHSWVLPVSDASGSSGAITVVGSSAVGMLSEVVFVALLLFGMCLPFVAADGVARDYRQRVHELLMTTPVPGWAYVVGRYLAGLLLGLALSGELLAAVYIVDALVGRRGGYPAPELATLLAVWALTVLPAMVLLVSLSFALGTLWPRLANVMKLVVLIAWIGIFVVGSSHLPSWYHRWDPTSYSLAAAGQSLVHQRYTQIVSGGSGPEAAFLAAQSRLPAFEPYVLPHLGLVALGLACVAVAAVGFRRYRDVLA